MGNEDTNNSNAVSWAKITQWGIAAAQALLLLMLSQQWKHEQVQDSIQTDLRVDVAAIKANRFTQADGVALERNCRVYADTRPHPTTDIERRVARIETALDRCCEMQRSNNGQR